MISTNFSLTINQCKINSTNIQIYAKGKLKNFCLTWPFSENHVTMTAPSKYTHKSIPN